MAYVVSACADQAEEINASLPNNSYHILDVLPGGVKDLEEPRYQTGLGDGSQNKMMHLIGKSSSAYNTFAKVVWSDKPTVFGFKVCSVSLLYWMSSLMFNL